MLRTCGFARGGMWTRSTSRAATSAARPPYVLGLSPGVESRVGASRSRTQSEALDIRSRRAIELVAGRRRVDDSPGAEFRGFELRSEHAGGRRIGSRARRAPRTTGESRGRHTVVRGPNKGNV